MVLLAVTTDTWIVTGLGFGIVLLLLFFLVFVMQFFGWTMQKIEAPKAPKEEKEETDVIAAIAMALHLAKASKHDAPTSMISPQTRDTAWNPKSEGFTNIGF